MNSSKILPQPEDFMAFNLKGKVALKEKAELREAANEVADVQSGRYLRDLLADPWERDWEDFDR